MCRVAGPHATINDLMRRVAGPHAINDLMRRVAGPHAIIQLLSETHLCLRPQVNELKAEVARFAAIRDTLAYSADVLRDVTAQQKCVARDASQVREQILISCKRCPLGPSTKF